MAYNRSVFPEGGYDTFPELYDLPPERIQDAKRYKALKEKPSKTPQEMQELNILSISLSDYIDTPEKRNKLNDAITSTQKFFVENVQGYVDAKQEEFDAEINKFTYKGIYNPSTQYYAKNYVTYNDGTGDNIFICVVNSINIDPTNATHWRKLGIKGEKGNDGIGLVFRAAWNNSSVYDAGDAVQYGGVIFACMEAHINQQPDLTQDTQYWAKAWDLMVTSTDMIGTRNITTSASNINFMTGEIIAFNPATDILSVYKNSTRLTKNVDYVINPNNQSIDKIGGTWNGTVDQPVFFEFVVKRQQINGLVFSDGQSIQNGTITKNKLSTDVQDSLDEIGVLSTKVSPETVLNTTSQNLSGAVNEIKSEVDAHKAERATEDKLGHIDLDTFKPWQKIDKITLSTNVAQLDIDLPSNYSEFKIIGKNLYSLINSNLKFRLNSDNTINNYRYAAIQGAYTLVQGSEVSFVANAIQAYNSSFPSPAFIVIDLKNDVDTGYTIITAELMQRSTIQNYLKGRWLDASKLIKINLMLESTSFLAGSIFEVWGR